MTSISVGSVGKDNSPRGVLGGLLLLRQEKEMLAKNAQALIPASDLDFVAEPRDVSWFAGMPTSAAKREAQEERSRDFASRCAGPEQLADRIRNAQLEDI